MRPFSFRAKLLAAQVMLVAAVVGFTMLGLERTLADDLRAETTRRLELQAAGAREWAQRGRHPQQIAERLAAIVGARVTVVGSQGEALADSEPDPEVESLSQQPEIRDALAGKTGRAVRAGRQGDVAFVAVRASDEVVLRLALPLLEVDQAIHEMRFRLLVAAVLGLFAAVGLGYFVANIAGAPLRAMRSAAREIAAGDYDVRLPPRTPDDFGELSVALAALARQLKSDAQRIDRLEAMRREFVANLSHEIRTPLAALSGYAETLTTTEQDEPTRRRALLAIERHARRLDVLASGLLRLSELEATDPRDVMHEPVDLEAIARHVAAAADRRSAGQRPSIEVHVDITARPHADPLGVEQVLDNLVGNAIAHAGPGVAVRITGRRDADRVVLEVSDDGVGIAAHHLPRVFDRFYRADKPRGDGSGSGLGLAIARHLVEAMEGTITIESTLGAGTRAIVSLPATPA